MNLAIQKLRKVWGKLAHAWLLISSLRPQSQGIQLLSLPGFFGGPATKALQLAPLCTAKGAPYSTLIALSAVRVPIALVRALRRLGARMILNQNGVYYPGWYEGDWRAANAYLRELFLASDFVHFQSVFAEESFYEWVGEDLRGGRPSEVLYNPVDLERYFPEPQLPLPTHFSPLRVLFFHDFHPRNFGLWSASQEVSALLAQACTETALEVVVMGGAAGAYVAEVSTKLVAWGRDLEAHGSKLETHMNPTRDEVAMVLRSCHVMIHLVPNDVCPNKVLEAMASGCFVVGTGSGGTPELLGAAGAIVAMPRSWDPRFPPPGEVSEAALSYLRDPTGHRARAIARAKSFSLDAWRDKIRKRAQLLACGKETDERPVSASH